MRELLAETIKWLGQGRSVSWATVINKSGSAPRQAGSRMLIAPQGALTGSVGGGELEARTLALAEELLPRARRGVLDFSPAGLQADATGMVCGGQSTVLVESLRPEDLPLLKRLEQSFLAGQPVFLATWAGGESESFTECNLLGESGNWPEGLLPAPCREMLATLSLATLAGPLFLEHKQSGCGLLVEPLRPSPRLVLFGGGHVALETAWLADRVGFEVVVVEERQEFAGRQRFPMAQKIYACHFEQALRELRLDADYYVIILTHSHATDMEALAKVIHEPSAYLGMIGSKRKREAIYAELKRRGVSQARLDQVHSPVGIKLPVETPAEIAVSIVAELISVRAAKRNEPLASFDNCAD